MKATADAVVLSKPGRLQQLAELQVAYLKTLDPEDAVYLYLVSMKFIRTPCSNNVHIFC